jgi:hypothetical protein
MEEEEGKITVFCAKKYIQREHELMIWWREIRTRNEHKRIILAGMRAPLTNFKAVFGKDLLN